MFELLALLVEAVAVEDHEEVVVELLHLGHLGVDLAVLQADLVEPEDPAQDRELFQRRLVDIHPEGFSLGQEGSQPRLINGSWPGWGKDRKGHRVPPGGYGYRTSVTVPPGPSKTMRKRFRKSLPSIP